MYSSVDEWLRQARDAAYRYESKLCEIRMLEGEAAKLMAQMVQAYRWPENLPQPVESDEQSMYH